MAQSGDDAKKRERPWAAFLGVTTSLMLAHAALAAPSRKPHAHQAQADNGPTYIVLDSNGNQLPGAGQKVDSVRYPASLTKVMTLYVALETLKADKDKPRGERTFPDLLSTQVKITAEATATSGQKMGLRVGQTVQLDKLLKNMLVDSDNDAATAIGDQIAGSVPAMALRMNTYAAKLGLTMTSFINPSGQDNLSKHAAYNRTTARDAALLGLKVSELAEQMAADEFRDDPRFKDITNPAKAVFGGRTLVNLEHDVLGSKGPLGRNVFAKGGENHAGESNLTVWRGANNTSYAVVVLDAPNGRSGMQVYRSLAIQEASHFLAQPPEIAAAPVAVVTSVALKPPGPRTGP